MTHVIGLTLVGIGCGVVALAGLGAALVRGDVFTRLHFVTPVTSIGAPSKLWTIPPHWRTLPWVGCGAQLSPSRTESTFA